MSTFLRCIAWQKWGPAEAGCPEQSCSHSQLAQCFFERSEYVHGQFAAFLLSINFFIALVIGPDTLGSLLKSKSLLLATFSLSACF
jgi:hypothetical protein